MQPDPQVVARLKLDAARKRLLDAVKSFRSDLFRWRMEQFRCEDTAQSPAAYHEAEARAEALTTIIRMLAEYPGTPVSIHAFTTGHTMIRRMKAQMEYTLGLLDKFHRMLVEAQGDAELPE